MIEIDPQKTKQLVFSKDEYFCLKCEIERAFTKLDTGEASSAYSLKTMRREYPVLAELLAGNLG